MTVFNGCCSSAALPTVARKALKLFEKFETCEDDAGMIWFPFLAFPYVLFRLTGSVDVDY